MQNRKSKKTRTKRGGFTSPRPQLPPPKMPSSPAPRMIAPAPATVVAKVPTTPKAGTTSTIATTIKGHADNLMKKVTGFFSSPQTGGKRRKTRRKTNKRSRKSRKSRKSKKRGRRTRRR